MQVWLRQLLPAVLILFSAGCNVGVEGKASDKTKSGRSSQREAEKAVLFPVEAVRPWRADISEYIKSYGPVEAERRVDLIPKSTGQCLAVFVEEGDIVKAGQIMAELEKDEIKAQITQTEVSLEQQRNSLKIADKSRAEGYGSDVDRDNAFFAVQQAEASLKVLEVQLKHLTIRAPIDGVITHRNIQVGMMVSPGAPAFSIMDPASFLLPIYLSEKKLPRLREDQEASVRFDVFPGESFVARVRRINPSVELGRVKVTLDFDDETKKRLREGLFARVALVVETHEGALVVPKDAIIDENARKYLMVVREKEASPDESGAPVTPSYFADQTEVRVGLEDSNVVEILSGIDEDALIVTLGQRSLKPGSYVTLMNARAEIEARAKLTTGEALAAAEQKAKAAAEARGQLKAQ